MEPNLDGIAAGDLDAQTLFATGLSALADGKTVPAKKRGSFLTRRFFSGTVKVPARTQTALDAAARTLDARANLSEPIAESPAKSAIEPSGEPRRAPAAFSHDPSAPVEGAVKNEMPPTATIPEPGARSAVHLAAEPAGEIAPPEIRSTAPTVNRPDSSASAHLPPRITVPTFSLPQTTMTPTQQDQSLPAGRASAQLTLGFEITSLQLSPFFRLASVQLKALSNVVSLHLIAAQQADQPLAAGISFQIERVELDDASRLKSILLKPLSEAHEAAVPASRLQVESVAITGDKEDAPISVTTSGAASTVVQLVGTFAIAAMEFSPAFEIDSLRVEPASNTVLLRVAPSSEPGARNLPSSFEIAEVQLDDGARVRGARLLPSMAGNG